MIERRTCAAARCEPREAPRCITPVAMNTVSSCRYDILTATWIELSSGRYERGVLSYTTFEIRLPIVN